MKNFKFSHYISNMALNSISVAVYCNKDNSVYKLIAEKDGLKIRGTIIVELTADQYEDLPSDPYDAMSRFLHAAAMCGIDFH